MFVLFLKDAQLVAGDVVAIDGTKVRAHNSMKNNYNKKKVEDHLKRIDEKTNNYLQELEANDKQDDTLNIKDVNDKLQHLKTRVASAQQRSEAYHFFYGEDWIGYGIAPHTYI